jgi:hypothetical protein
MKKLYSLFTLLILMSGNVQSQCTETDVERVMLIGDSWAAMMNTDNTINSVLDRWGHSGYTYYTNAILAENGTKTTDFLQANRLNEIQTQLLARPSIDFIHLSIGGNDVLNQWNKSWSQAKTDSLLDSVYSRIVQIIDFIKVVRPGVRVLWSGYAYPNFGEIIGEMGAFGSTHPFYGTWNGMGQPNFVELNGVLNYYSTTMETLAANDPQVEFVKATGLMQYVYGQSANLSVPPGGNYAALTAPMPLGFPNYPSPKNAMRNYVIFRDCFHLAPDAFFAFVSYHTQKYYHKAMMGDQYFLSAGGNMDGSVSDVGNVVNGLQVGTAAAETYKMQLTFNTSTMPPDTGAASASIFLRREVVAGTNPIGNNMQITVKSGNFGATLDVEALDFVAPGDAVVTPCQFGTANVDGGWVRLDLPAAVLPFINATNNLQVMIAAPAGSGLAAFTGAGDPDFAPVLNITYGPSFVSVPEVANASADVQIYPNPTRGEVMIDAKGNQISSVEVYDLPGKLVLTAGAAVNKIDLSELNNGVYIVKAYTEKGAVVKRIVKK